MRQMSIRDGKGMADFGMQEVRKARQRRLRRL